jgi:hypothetical protein
MSPKLHKKSCKEDMETMLSRLNLLFGENSAWFATEARKSHVDLFGDPIPVGATYYKRLVGKNPRPLIILSHQSLSRFCRCLAAANPMFDVLVEILAEEERLLMEERKDPSPECGG